MAESEERVMRVLHLVKTSVGASWAFRQMRELVKLGVDVHVALPKDGPRYEDYSKAGVKVHPFVYNFSPKRPWAIPAKLREFRSLVKSVSPDIIHSHFVVSTLIMRLALGKKSEIPRIFQVPGPLHLENKATRIAELKTAGASDRWIASCKWTYDFYRNFGISDDRLYLSFYGVDLDDFAAGQRGKLRAELEIGDESFIVGMVAYMYGPKRWLGHKRGIKGHEDLIEALSICIKRGLDVYGIFVGGAWDGAFAYEKRIRALGREKCGERAIFLGNRSDIADCYADFDVAVHPSLSENLGGASESMIMGVPTIASNVGGLPDLVKHNETGLLVPPRAPEALADAIEWMINNCEEACELAERGRGFARYAMDVKRTSAEVADCYEDTLRQTRQ